MRARMWQERPLRLTGYQAVKIDDIQIKRARRIAHGAHPSELRLHLMQAGKQLRRRQARFNFSHSIHISRVCRIRPGRRPPERGARNKLDTFGLKRISRLAEQCGWLYAAKGLV